MQAGSEGQWHGDPRPSMRRQHWNRRSEIDDVQHMSGSGNPDTVPQALSHNCKSIDSRDQLLGAGLRATGQCVTTAENPAPPARR